MNRNEENNIELKDRYSSSILKEGVIWKLLGITIGLFLIYTFLLAGQKPGVASVIIAIIPLCFVIFLSILNFYRRIFYMLFASHFVLMVISAYVDVMMGAVTFFFNTFIITLFLLISTYRKTSWKESRNGMLLLYSIWAIYCVAELFNPNAVQEAWNIAITHYIGYAVICAILVPLSISRSQHIQWLLIIWSIFIIIATLKGYAQKTYGFNEREMRFLYELGGAETHIIWSGIRYFSIFTDAANYGVHMAMAALGFGISAMAVKSKLLKIYFFLIVLMAIYGVGLSGTRSALAVPFAGLFLFIILLSRNWKAITIGSILIIVLFSFFRFTAIGNGNEYIRKMRSAFTPTEDASYQVRVINRERMQEYMAAKPFGYGLGLGSKAERFRPKEYMPIPPDSWLINVWADTGIIGFVLYVLIHIILIAWCSWIIMFKIKNKRLKNFLAAWICMNAGFFLAAYANDVMQYPNIILVYTGFALCFAGPLIDKKEMKADTIESRQRIGEG